MNSHRMLICAAAILASSSWALLAQQPESGRPASKAEPAEAGKLDDAEASLGRRYRQFEETLLRMAEYLRKTEPERADLLIRAIGKSKEDRVLQQMEQISELLKSDQFGDAIGRQEHLVGSLKSLLELLQSEDRRHQLEEERKYYENLRKEVNKLAAREKDLRAATERKGAPRDLADRQKNIGSEADALLDKVRKEDQARGAEGKKNQKKQGDPNEKPDSNSENRGDNKQQKDGKQNDSKDPKQNDLKPGDSKQNEKGTDSKDPKEGDDAKPKDPAKQAPSKSKPQDDAKPKGEGKSNRKGQDQKDGKPQKPQPGQEGQEGEQPDSQQDPQQQDGQADPQQPQPEKRQTPGREEIEAARKAMQQAEEELKKLKAENALEQEEDAIQKLEEAKAKLEKMLRQLREEEKELALASLEARFAKMLLIEVQIQLETTNLAKVKKEAWTVKNFGKSRELSVQQDALAAEAGKALVLLREEGSSVAFTQGVEQLRDDMLGIARLLEKNDAGELTQSMERDVIETLEEMVSAMQAEIENRRKAEEQRQQQQQQQSAQQERQRKLVEQIAELKMLRSLQMRVNRRTKQIGRLIRGEEAQSVELGVQLQELSRRQAEIQEATHTIATGRNE